MTLDRWKILAQRAETATDPAAISLINDAWKAAPPGFVQEENVVALLPRRPVAGECRICGKTDRLTREHIPPKATGNKLRHQSHTFSEYLDSELGQVEGGVAQQGGIFGYTLCQHCNALTGRRYGAEYKRWSELAGNTLLGLASPTQMDQVGRPLAWPVKFGDAAAPVRPGALVRQVLSFMCTLSGSWNLAQTHPEVRHAILSGATDLLPSQLELGMSLYHGPAARLVGPTLQVVPGEGTWRWLMEMAYPPLAFLLVVASNIEEAGLGLMISDWVQYSRSEEKSFEGVLRIGFGWTAYPGDYRSRSEIEGDRSDHDQPPFT